MILDRLHNSNASYISPINTHWRKNKELWQVLKKTRLSKTTKKKKQEVLNDRLEHKKIKDKQQRIDVWHTNKHQENPLNLPFCQSAHIFKWKTKTTSNQNHAKMHNWKIR